MPAADESPPSTILQRMTDAGISEDRARWHLGKGVMRLDGDVVTDPEHPAPWPSRVVVGPG